MEYVSRKSPWIHFDLFSRANQNSNGSPNTSICHRNKKAIYEKRVRSNETRDACGTPWIERRRLVSREQAASAETVINRSHDVPVGTTRSRPRLRDRPVHALYTVVTLPSGLASQERSRSFNTLSTRSVGKVTWRK